LAVFPTATLLETSRFAAWEFAHNHGLFIEKRRGAFECEFMTEQQIFH